MLAGTVEFEEQLSLLNYPVHVTPKLDGIRTLTIPHENEVRALSRSFKRVPNLHTRTVMESALPPYLDGEFMIPDTPFEDIGGAWRRESGKPDFQYMVFDFVPEANIYLPYTTRMDHLRRLKLPKFCDKLLPLEVNSEEEILAFEEVCLQKGFEGVMIRSPLGPYKCGRSTVKEGYLLKFKRFRDGEAEVRGFEELMHNDNEATQDAFGRTKRSGHKENKRSSGMLGALVVEGNGQYEGVEFRIGTGFDTHTRQWIWDHQENYIGQTVTYRYQDVGAKDKPRFPKFVGFRPEEDR